MLDFKQLTIIDCLIQSPTITTQDLITNLNYSFRQFEYTLRKLNATLVEQHVDPINTSGIYITISPKTYRYMLNLRSDKQLTLPANYIISNDERQLLLLFRIATSNTYLSLFHLTDFVQVSQSTISKDIKEINTQIAKFHLQIIYDRQHGYQLSGYESNIRFYLIKTIIESLNNNSEKMINTYIKQTRLISFAQMSPIVQKLSSRYHINFVENRLREFCYCVIFMLPRFQINATFIPQKIDPNAILVTSEYHLAQDLLEQFNIDSGNSILYLATLTQSMSVGTYTNSTDDQKIQKILENITQEFTDISGIEFANQNLVTQQLFTHFCSMYYRLRYHFPTLNPLTNKVKNEYSEIFLLLKRVLSHYTVQLGTVPEEEVAFLTIHLIGFIYSSNHHDHQVKNAAIICPNGVGSSALAYLQLTSLFPQINFLPPFKYEDLNEHLSKIDLIFSTFYSSDLFNLNRPCFVINPIMNTREKYELLQNVNTSVRTTNYTALTVNSIIKVVSNHVTNNETLKNIERDLLSTLKGTQITDNASGIRLPDVIDPNYIQTNLIANTAEEAIRKCATPLIDTAAITPDYLNAVLSSQFSNFVIAPSIALPHAAPKFGANRIAISIASLQKPLRFGDGKNNPVKYIFFLSATNSTDHLQALQGLIKLIGDNNFLALLSSTNDNALIYQYILDHC